MGDTNFTDSEIKTIRKEYLHTHGIYTGISNRIHRNVSTQVLSTYWTKCPFLTDDNTKHERWTVESETPTFIKFHQKPYRFRKETIVRRSAYDTLHIAYRDNALNKERFHFGENLRATELPKWEVVKHYTDVVVRWDDSDHTIEETYEQVWFLPNKVMYMGVAVELSVSSQYRYAYEEAIGKGVVSTTVFCSPIKTERTPTPVPLYIVKHFYDRSTVGFRRGDYNGINPFDHCTTNLDLDHQFDRTGVRKVFLIDGAEFPNNYHGDYAEKKALLNRFSALCETTFSPYAIRLTSSYTPSRKITTERYGSAVYSRGLASLTDMKHSASTVPLTDPQMETMRKHKEAFADELVRTCLHPERLERLYGEGFVDILADQ